MTHKMTHPPIRGPLRRLLAFACALLFVAPTFADRATLSSMTKQGYIFLHPMFASMPWNSSLERLDLVLPDTLANVAIKSFGVSRGSDNAVAAYTIASGDLFIMPVLYEKLVAPCFDNALTFDQPRKVSLSALSISGGKPLYVVRDSLYASDSIHVVIPSSAAPLSLHVATVRAATATVTRIDTITCSERRTGQQIIGVSGAPDSVTGQDRGIWVTGTNGLIRYIPYTNHRFGTEAVRDLSQSTVSVTHTNGTFAVSIQGGIYRRNQADTFFTNVATASGALWRVYPQGAIGDNGRFKEYANGTWRTDKTFGTGAYRYANFIRRPGGFGVELLDSNWAYSVYTYRDTASRIAATAPASLSTNINGTPFLYDGKQQLDITIMLDDPDSNFSDYALTLVSGSSSIDLKNDGKYAIKPLPDSASCHIGSLKMTSGRVRLTLNNSQVTVQHDCALGALDPTCLACYWKTYSFQFAKILRKADTIRIKTGLHLLRIVNDTQTMTLNRIFTSESNATLFPIHFASGSRCYLYIPNKQGTRPLSLAIHDLKGRRIVCARVRHDQHSLELPNIRCSGIVIVTYVMNDGSTQSIMTNVADR
jgi:hypothetical protein